MTDPTIAIVTRVSRPAKYLERVLEGLFKQSGAKLHWSIVTQRKLSEAHNACLERARQGGIYVTITKAKPDASLGKLANLGVKAVTSGTVILHDDDDMLRKDFFGPALALFQADNIVAVACHAAIIKENGHQKNLDFVLSPGQGIVDPEVLAKDNLMATNALIYRRSAFENYPEHVDVAEDWLFNLQLIKQGKIIILPKVCASVFQRERTETNTDRQAHIDMQARIRGDSISDQQKQNRKFSQKLKRTTDRLTYKLGFFLPR